MANVESGVLSPSGKSLLERTPKLSKRGLTFLLIVMCIIPTVTILALYNLMPAVYPGELDAKVNLVNVPADSYYRLPIEERNEIESASVAIYNIGDVEWTNFYVRVNRHYNIYDTESFPPGASRIYRLDRFVAKIGAMLDTRHVQVKQIEIYARVPSGARYTFDKDF